MYMCVLHVCIVCSIIPVFMLMQSESIKIKVYIPQSVIIHSVGMLRQSESICICVYIPHIVIMHYNKYFLFLHFICIEKLYIYML